MIQSTYLLELGQKLLLTVREYVDAMCAAYLVETEHSGFLIHEKTETGYKYRIANSSALSSEVSIQPPQSIDLSNRDIQSMSNRWQALTNIPASQAEVFVETKIESTSINIQRTSNSSHD